MVFHGEGVAVLEGLGFSVDLEGQGAATELSLTLWYTPRFGPVGSALDVLTRSNVTNDQKRSVRTLASLAEHRAGDAPSGTPEPSRGGAQPRCPARNATERSNMSVAAAASWTSGRSSFAKAWSTPS